VSDESDPVAWGMAPDDGELSAQLREMFRTDDPPPPEVMELARESFLLRALDAELAALVEDSERLNEEGEDNQRALAVRGPGRPPEPRQLTFHFLDGRSPAELIIAIQIEVIGQVRRLTGHLTPPGPADLELRQPTVPQPRRFDADRLGRFLVDDVLPGPASLTCRRAGTPPVVTEWTFL
jgi:hypothetical protein